MNERNIIKCTNIISKNVIICYNVNEKIGFWKEMKNMDKIAVLIPCYNEAKTIKKVVEDFKKE